MSLHPFERLELSAEVVSAIFSQALAEAPLECCGLLAGRISEGIGSVEVRYPLVNEAASPVEFVSEARGMFDAVRDIDRRELTILAVYHSHPATAPVPSKTDLARNYSPEVVTVIVSLQEQSPTLRAWWLRDDGYEEAEIIIRS